MMKSVSKILAMAGMMGAMFGTSEGVGVKTGRRHEARLIPLTKKQLKVRAKNKMARKSRKINRRLAA